MTTKSKASANKPVFRLAFASRNGTDLNYPVEVGAVFARKEAEKGLVARWTVIPADLKDGVLFLFPVKDEPDLLSGAEGAAQ